MHKELHRAAQAVHAEVSSSPFTVSVQQQLMVPALSKGADARHTGWQADSRRECLCSFKGQREHRAAILGKLLETSVSGHPQNPNCSLCT